jgi:hypothetical protein
MTATAAAGNGQAPATPEAEAINRSAINRSAKAISAIEKPIHDTLGILVRGILVSCPGFPVEVIVTAVAYHIGNVLGESVRCELTQHMQLRANLRTAFEEGMRAAPMNPPPTTQQIPIDLKGLKG